MESEEKEMTNRMTRPILQKPDLRDHFCANCDHADGCHGPSGCNGNEPDRLISRCRCGAFVRPLPCCTACRQPIDASRMWVGEYVFHPGCAPSSWEDAKEWLREQRRKVRE